MSSRIEALVSQFHTHFGVAEPGIWSAPGRTEIIGNHTDHQHGKVLAAAVNTDMLAAAAPNGTNLVRILSEGYALFAVDLDQLRPSPAEYGTTDALVRGVCAAAAERGYLVHGFDACITSNVPQGSGLSSSAAFEVLIAAVVNDLFCGGALTATDLAVMGQYAENVFFGKPCGLMDQMACAWGGIIRIDFADPAVPAVTPVDFDFASAGHSLCFVDLKSDHASLTHEYAAIPAEIKAVARMFGCEVLRGVDEDAFYDRLDEVRAEVGDRAVLRAIHVFNENRRVDACTEALSRGDFDAFLHQIGESGRSSWTCLQNVTVTGSTGEQAAAVALALCGHVLGERGAYRIHGGGFGGTVQAFVPNDMIDQFRGRMESVFGQGSCHIMQIRPSGAVKISNE